jgi:hypothetical protein
MESLGDCCALDSCTNIALAVYYWHLCTDCHGFLHYNCGWRIDDIRILCPLCFSENNKKTGANSEIDVDDDMHSSKSSATVEGEESFDLKSASTQSSDSSGSIFNDVSLRQSMEDVLKGNVLSQNAIIQDEMEDFAEGEDAEVAKVMDRDTIVKEETVNKWKCITVFSPDGKEHNKHQLVKNMFSPDGVLVVQRALSMDRNSRVKGQLRHAKQNKNDGTGTSVSRAYHNAEKICGYDPLRDENNDEATGEEILFGDAIIFMVMAKNTILSSVKNEKLVTGRALFFGRNGKKASLTSMPFTERDDWHITAAVDETIHITSSQGVAAVGCTGRTLATVPNLNVASCIVYKPKLEIFPSDDNNLVEHSAEPQYARVFLLHDLELLFKSFVASSDPPPKSSAIIPPIHVNGCSMFVIDNSMPSIYCRDKKTAIFTI